MEKDFDGWHATKKHTQNVRRPMFRERDIWWCSLGVNIGDEQDGKGEHYTRPVLVLKKFNQHILLAVPFSTQAKQGMFYHTLFFRGKEQTVLLSQMRLLDARRFGSKMGELNPNDFAEVRAKIQELLR